MALEQITFNIAAFNDADAGGNNYYAGKIYEIYNKTGTLADIFSDASGANPIVQNGISNVSDSSGKVLFYAGNGDYYASVDSENRPFKVGIEDVKIAEEIATHNNDITAHPSLISTVTVEADRAEAAADAAELNAGIYANTTAGLAATSIGDYFSVPAIDTNDYLSLYLHGAGDVAVLIKTYPSSNYIDQLSDEISFTSKSQALGVISSEKKGGDITITGNDAVIAIPTGWRLLRSGGYIDLPAYNGTVQSINALVYNPTTNLYTSTGLGSFDNTENVLVLYVIQGRVFSPHPDVAQLFAYQYEAKTMVFDKKGEPDVVITGTDASITFKAGSRVVTNDVYRDIPIGTAPTIPSLNGLYFDINDQTLSISLFSARKAANQVLLCVNISGQLSSPFPKFQESLSNAIPYGEVTFVSDDQEITIANGTGTERLVTFKAGSRLLGGVNDTTFFDLPTTVNVIPGNKILLANKTTGALNQIDLPANLQPPFGIPSGEVVLIYNFNGVLTSPIPRIENMINLALAGGLGRTLDGLYFPDSSYISLVGVDGSKNVTIDFPTFRYVDETGVYLVGPQQASVNQLKAVFLDLDTLLLIDNVNADAYNTDPRKVLIAYNVNAWVNSPITSLQKQLDLIVNINDPDKVGYNVTEITVGIGETYETLTAMYAAITDATEKNRYRVLLLEGTYIESGPNGFGLELKDYIYIYGQSRNKCVIYGPESPDGASTFNYDVIHKVANALVMDVTLVAYKNKYAVHSDLDTNNFHFTMQNCITRHNGSLVASNVYWDIGIGTRNSQKLTFIDVEMQGYGLRIHGPLGESTRNATRGLEGWGLELIGCKIHRLDLEDFLEYYKSEINIQGSVIDEVELWVDPTWYNANPSNNFMNRGWKNIGQGATYAGNEIGIVTYRTQDTIDTIGDRYLIPGVNKNCYNTGAIILKGQAVKRMPSIAKVASPTFQQTHDRVALWDGDGILLGWAEEDIQVANHGYVHYSGNPEAVISSSSVAVSFGDKLTLNSSGELTNWTSGDYHARAIDDIPSGGGLIKVVKA